MEEVLPEGSVLVDVAATDKAGVIAEAAKLLASASQVPADTIEAALKEREGLGSTGVGGGIGLPHARLHRLRSTHAVFLRLKSPISFESMDGKPVDLLCAIVAPDEPGSALLMAVAAVSRVLRDAASAAALRVCRGAEDARGILLQASFAGR